MIEELTLEYFIGQKSKQNQNQLFIDIVNRCLCTKNRIPLPYEDLENLRVNNFINIEQYQIKIIAQYLGIYLYVFEQTYNIPVEND